jgi:hypothetical protein
MTPNQFHGVQFGSVGRQQLGADAMGLLASQPLTGSPT